VDYLKLRDIATEDKKEPVFPENYGVAQRDKYYKSISYSGWGGASGHDV
jgi:ADP-ribosylarginine hydrolase